MKIRIVLATATLLWFVNPACYAVSAANAGFEAGLNHWTTLDTGDVTTYNSLIVQDFVNVNPETHTILPRLGGTMAVLDLEDGNSFPNATQLNSFFNTDLNGHISPMGVFEAIKSTPITVTTENNKITQYYNLFLRDVLNDPGDPENAFAVIIDSTTNGIVQITELNRSLKDNNGVVVSRYTDWRLFESNPLAPKDYILGFFIQDNIYPSPVLALDGSGPAVRVPEPPALMLLLVGLGLALLSGKRPKIGLS